MQIKAKQMDQINYQSFFFCYSSTFWLQEPQKLRRHHHQALVYKMINYIHFAECMKRGIFILSAPLHIDLFSIKICFQISVCQTSS